jgi:four helix bundle protein
MEQNGGKTGTTVYNLEKRCLQLAYRTNEYVRKLPKDIPNIENSRQLARSIGANYIEANESLSKKDFAMRMKISKKESKESVFWLKLTKPLASEDKEKIT